MLIGRSFFSSVFFLFYDINMFCTSKNPGSRQYGMRFDLSHLLNAIAKIENTRRSTHTIGILDSWEWHAVEKQQTHTPHTQANAKKNGTTSKRVSKRERDRRNGIYVLCIWQKNLPAGSINILFETKLTRLLTTEGCKYSLTLSLPPSAHITVGQFGSWVWLCLLMNYDWRRVKCIAIAGKVYTHIPFNSIYSRKYVCNARHTMCACKAFRTHIYSWGFVLALMWVMAHSGEKKRETEKCIYFSSGRWLMRMRLLKQR